MSSPKQVTMRDLVEEAKKRIVFLIVCVVGLSYLLSLTSSSVLVNLPAAASLIILLRYFSLDFEMRRKAATYNSKPSTANTISQIKPPESHKVIKRSDWRRKVNSPVVEDAIDRLTRHLVSEWVADLWYSRLTPDKEGPEELVQIINGVLGEFSGRMRNINLIDLLTRDFVNVICTHLELFRASQAKIDKQQSVPLTIENRDLEIRRILAAEDKLHPALFSAEAEHKVLQCLMDGLISFTFRHEDLQCSFFRFTVRELLACAVMRPVLNLANPRFINERIESLAISMKKAKGATASQETSQSKPNGSSRISSDHFSRFLDPSATGVELVSLKNDQSRTTAATAATDLSKDPLLSIDTRSTCSWGSLPLNSQNSVERGIQRHLSGGKWGDMLDMMSDRKTKALAPENFENMWTKGRNYKKKERENRVFEQVSQHSVGKSVTAVCSRATSKPREKHSMTKVDTDQSAVENSFLHADQKKSNFSSVTSFQEDDEDNPTRVETGSSSSNTSEEEETGNVLDSPGTKVWDGRSNRNLTVSHIHHPLENPDKHILKKSGRRQLQYQRLPRSQSGRKRFRLNSQKLPVWQEVERTSFLSGDGQDILSSRKGHAQIDESSDDSEIETFGGSQSGSVASPSASFISIPESHSSTVNIVQNSLMVDSFFKLRCESSNGKSMCSASQKLLQLPTVSGSIEVWDFLSVDSQTYLFSNSFSIVETLSVGLEDKPSERSTMVSNTIGPTGREHLGNENKESPRKMKDNFVADGLKYNAKEMAKSPVKNTVKESGKPLQDSGSGPDTMVQNISSSLRNLAKAVKGRDNDGLEERSDSPFDASTDPTLPNEVIIVLLVDDAALLRDFYAFLRFLTQILLLQWVPPNLSVPILDLVDVIFQLQDGGWIRRQAFWVAKQVLQLGMGDAFDDWLIEKIQLLRRGSVLASGIKRLEQILWPDGIFITKHPKRRHPSQPSQPPSSPNGHQPAEISSPRLSEEQKEQADERAKFVYELMIDKAPAAIVGLVGRKEYEQCAKDLYFFIQSSVCLKQLVFDLLELLLLSSFPELEYVFRQFHEEKHKFGEFKES
ncbi:hypothetical protein LWI28_028762 [Acer negundo]|uniref:PXA domain-containing protein n=1 Tax=Acer negundo TaxID=4023 RepID=A0AAD5IGR2_ACENE|nr:hypothetical protein LWI28_028762 [Acer negundo]